MTAVKPRDPLFDEALVPTGDKTTAALDTLADFVPRTALGKQQNHPRPSGVLRPIRPAVCSTRQIHTFGTRQI
jgi:hypothetical protein